MCEVKQFRNKDREKLEQISKEREKVFEESGHFFDQMTMKAENGGHLSDAEIDKVFDYLIEMREGQRATHEQMRKMGYVEWLDNESKVMNELLRKTWQECEDEEKLEDRRGLHSV